jgi:hypothetical protein
MMLVCNGIVFGFVFLYLNCELSAAVVLFVELEGLQEMMLALPPKQFVTSLNAMVSTMDMVVDQLHIAKIEALESTFIAAALGQETASTMVRITFSFQFFRIKNCVTSPPSL